MVNDLSSCGGGGGDIVSWVTKESSERVQSRLLMFHVVGALGFAGRCSS